jgi:hypothetical protein
MQHCPSSEANRSSDSQKIPHILFPLSQETLHLYKSSPPLQPRPSYLLKIHFNSILPARPSQTLMLTHHLLSDTINMCTQHVIFTFHPATSNRKYAQKTLNNRTQPDLKTSSIQMTSHGVDHIHDSLERRETPTSVTRDFPVIRLQEEADRILDRRTLHYEVWVFVEVGGDS